MHKLIQWYYNSSVLLYGDNIDGIKSNVEPDDDNDDDDEDDGVETTTTDQEGIKLAFKYITLYKIEAQF